MDTMKLTAKFGADTSDFEEGINRISQQAEQFGSQMEALRVTLSNAFAQTAVDMGKAFGSGTTFNPMLDLIHQLGKAIAEYAEILISLGTTMLVAGDPAGTLKLGEGIA